MAQDEWVDVKSPVATSQPQTQQDEWQDVPSSKGTSGSWPETNPLYGQRFIPQFVKSAYDNIPGAKQLINAMPNADIFKQRMEQTPPPQNLQAGLGKVVPQAGTSYAESMPFFGAAEVVPAVPFLGKAVTQGAAAMAGLGGTKAALSGHPQQIIPEAVKGAEQGAVMGGAGQAVSNIAGRLAQPLVQSFNPVMNAIGKQVQPIATGLGMGAASAAQAPSGEKMANFIAGSALGYQNPAKTKIPSTPDEAIQQSVENAFNKGIKPASYGGSQSAVQRQGYLNQATIAVKAALSDPSNLDIKDAQGNVTGQIDLNGGRQSLSQIISNHLNNTFAKYDAMKQQAEGAGVTIPVTDLATQLKLYANSGVIKANPTLFKQVGNYAEGIATDMLNKKEYTPSEAQDFLKHINSITDYNPNTAQTPGANAVNLQIADYFRKNMDNQISQNLDPRYQQLRNEYAAGKTVQQDIERSAQKQEKQPEISGGLPTILKGYKVISGVAKAAGAHDYMGAAEDLGEAAALHGMQRANNPDIAVSKMMKKVSGILATKPVTQVQPQNINPNPGVVNNPQMANPPINQSPIIQPTAQQVQQFGTPNAPQPSTMRGGGNTMSGSMSQVNPLSNLPPEALKSLKKQIKIEKIIRS